MTKKQRRKEFITTSLEDYRMLAKSSFEEGMRCGVAKTLGVDLDDSVVADAWKHSVARYEYKDIERWVAESAD